MNATDKRLAPPSAGPFLWVLAGVVLVAGAAVATRLGLENWSEPGSVLLLLVASAVAGFFPVRLPALRINGTATHVFVFAALVMAGPFAAICTDLAGLIGAIIGRRRRPLVIHLIFNLGLVVLCASAAGAAWHALGGRQGQVSAEALIGASVIYFGVNGLLVGIAVALETHKGLLEVLRDSILWTALPFFAGLAGSAALVALWATPAWALLMVLPSVMAMLRILHRPA